MNYEEATQIVERYLHSEADKVNGFGSALPGYVNPNIDLVILHEKTEVHDFGWVFVSASKKNLQSNNIRDAVAGNAPVIVDKFSKKLIVTGTALPISQYVHQYVTTGDPHQEG